MGVENSRHFNCSFRKTLALNLYMLTWQNIMNFALEDLEASEMDFQKASTNTSSSDKTSIKKSGKKSRKSNKTAISDCKMRKRTVLL